GSGRTESAIDEYRRAVALDPECAAPRAALGAALAHQGRTAEAIRQYRDLLERFPDYRATANNLAWLLATKGDGKRDAAEAGQPATRVCQATEHRVPELLDTLALACAAAGRFDEAARTAEQGIAMARRDDKPRLADEMSQRLSAYRAGRLPEFTP